MAFISSFHGTKTIGHSPTILAPKSSRRTTMKFGTEKLLEKYDDMSRQVPQAAVPSKPSSVWSSYSQTVLEKVAPTRRVMFAPKGSYESMMATMFRRSFMFTAPGGAPALSPADSYMSECVTRQYKAMSCSNGIYGVSCTEGTTRGAAEDSRTIALGARFRMGQRSTSAKFADYYTNRKHAIMATHECSYEEKLVAKFPQVAAAMITGMSEASGACVRYVAPTDPVEKYMTECVDKQNKFRAVPQGVYGVMCQDGSAKGLPEFKRVQGLAAKFRAGQIGKGAAEDRKFAVRKWARENFAHMCSYEEKLFNDYPSVSMAMRAQSVRY